MLPTRLSEQGGAGELTVRVIDRDGAPWFVAKDVCRALRLTNVSEAVSALDDDEKGISLTETLRGVQEAVVLSESGLYTLIVRSRQAMTPGTVQHRFRKWVTSEVLPAIRQTGRYEVPQSSPAAAVQDVQPPSGLAARPFDEWSLEERRTNLSLVNAARHTFNQASAAWMWERVGLPVPPRHLLPAWWQADLELRGRQGRALTITVPIGGEPN